MSRTKQCNFNCDSFQTVDQIQLVFNGIGLLSQTTPEVSHYHMCIRQRRARHQQRKWFRTGCTVCIFNIMFSITHKLMILVNAFISVTLTSEYKQQNIENKRCAFSSILFFLLKLKI